MPENKQCPKDCTKCGFYQHAFCAAKMSFDSFTVMNAMMQRIDAMAATIADLSARLEAPALTPPQPNAKTQAAADSD